MFDDDRPIRIAVYMLENSSTVRKTARQFGVSKSTVHKDISARLKSIDNSLFIQVTSLMEKNKSERHIRGGMATKEKYLKMMKNHIN